MEFVWQFYRTNGCKDQIVFGVTKQDGCYVEYGVVDINGDYTNTPKMVTDPSLMDEYHNLINFMELVQLMYDCKEYMNED